ncbi:hypothetical protein BHE74_00015682 [Ensete ventricosum]|nr:hypothetical protein BHE74_00015682 [Ensete ventricosum]
MQSHSSVESSFRAVMGSLTMEVAQLKHGDFSSSSNLIKHGDFALYRSIRPGIPLSTLYHTVLCIARYTGMITRLKTLVYTNWRPEDCVLICICYSERIVAFELGSMLTDGKSVRNYLRFSFDELCQVSARYSSSASLLRRLGSTVCAAKNGPYKQQLFVGKLLGTAKL